MKVRRPGRRPRERSSHAIGKNPPTDTPPRIIATEVHQPERSHVLGGRTEDTTRQSKIASTVDLGSNCPIPDSGRAGILNAGAAGPVTRTSSPGTDFGLAPIYRASEYPEIRYTANRLARSRRQRSIAGRKPVPNNEKPARLSRARGSMKRGHRELSPRQGRVGQRRRRRHRVPLHRAGRLGARRGPHTARAGHLRWSCST